MLRNQGGDTLVGAQLAVVQTESKPFAKAENLTRSLEWIRQAAEAGAQFVILPELCCTEYMGLVQNPDRLRAVAEPPNGPSISSWAEACRQFGIHVAAGFVEEAPEGLYNSAAVIGPAGLVGVYRKTHLFDSEKELFVPGNRGYPVFDLPFGRVGVLVCYDLRFVEAARILALEGADVLAVPTTWTDLHKPDPWNEQGWCMANYLAVGHAYTNRCYVACANRIGTEKGVRYLGCSLVVDPYGKVIAGVAPPDKEGIWIAPFDRAIAQSKELGPKSNLWADRRTDLYPERLGLRAVVTNNK